jgi:hypothetical protein
MRFHDLRHTAATLLLEAGVSPLTVAQRLGHATPAVVMNTYGHVTPRMQEQANAALDAILHACVWMHQWMYKGRSQGRPCSVRAESLGTPEPTPGLEPGTCGLQNRCSAN